MDEARMFTLEHCKQFQCDLLEEVKEEMMAVEQECEGCMVGLFRSQSQMYLALFS